MTMRYIIGVMVFVILYGSVNTQHHFDRIVNIDNLESTTSPGVEPPACKVAGFHIPWLPISECVRLEIIYDHVPLGLFPDTTKRILKALEVFRHIEELADRYRPREPLKFTQGSIRIREEKMEQL